MKGKEPIGQSNAARPIKRDLENRYARRRFNLLKQIKGQAALFPAAPRQILSRDLAAQFRQNSDLFYLTGFAETDAALLLLGSNKGPRSILYVHERDPKEERWQGERLGIKRAKRAFQVDEVRDYKLFEAELRGLLSDASTLHYALGSHPEVDRLVVKLCSSPSGPRTDFPNVLSDSRLLTAEMRWVKDRDEILAIKHAADITAHAFEALFRRMKEITSEAHAASVIDSYFIEMGAGAPAFPSIVASGRNATVMHHTPLHQPLWRRELVLIDAGAFFRGYCGDITRTVPASGKFSWLQADVYDCVHRALQAALKRARPGGTLKAIHEAALGEIVQGLIDLRVIKGSKDSLIEEQKYKPYFMHRTSHWLGLDVHDISPFGGESGQGYHPSHSRPLVPGNVFTVEPGLYFDPADSRVPRKLRGIGIRIEEDVLITESGAEVLSSAVPTKRAEIEELLG